MEQTITTKRFGVTADGEEVTLFRIQNNTNDYIELINYGCTIKGIFVHGTDGALRNLLCGYETLEQYETAKEGLVSLGIGEAGISAAAHKLWQVNDVGENYVFLSCRLTAEESGSDSDLAVGAKVMWVNLNRIVIDLFVTAKDNAAFSAACALPFCLSDTEPVSGCALRVFCPTLLSNGQAVLVDETPYADMAFVPVSGEQIAFLSPSEEMKPMAELAHGGAKLTVSAYGNMDLISCEATPSGDGVVLSQTNRDIIQLHAGETFASRVIYGFDRLYTQEELHDPEPSPFSAFIDS